MRFKQWLFLEETQGLVANVIDRGPDGTYLKFQDGRKMGPIASIKQIQGNYWQVFRKGNPVGITVQMSSQFAQAIMQKIQNKPQQQGVDLNAINAHANQNNLKLYRGIAGNYDPEWKSAYQSFSDNMATAAQVARGQAQIKNQNPTVISIAVPWNYINADDKNPNPNMINVHYGLGSARIFDVPRNLVNKFNPRIVNQK